MQKHYLLLLPSLSCTLWALILFLNRKRNTQSQNIWMLLMILMAGATYVWGLFYNGITDYKLHYKLDIIDTVFTLYLFPLSYFYFKSLAGPGWFGWRDVLWLIPGAFIGIVSIMFYLAMGDDNAAAYYEEAINSFAHGLKVHTAPIYQIQILVNMWGFYFVLLMQIFLLTIYSAIQLIHPKGYLRKFFTPSADKALRQNRTVLIGMWIIFLIYLIAFLGGYFLYIHTLAFAEFFMGVSGIVFFYLGYMVFKQTVVAPTVITAPVFKEEEEEKIIEHQPATIAEAFNALIDDKIYLQKDLHIEDVANMLHTDRTNVSQLLKEEYRCNFVEFISRKRIEYARHLMTTYPHFNQEQIAGMSGFTHASSFSRAFKQHIGRTFREVQK